jgi:PAS domain S-box-containing protein
VAPLPEGLLSSLFEQVPIALFDTEMRYLVVSPNFLSDTARLTCGETFAPADVIGRSLYETFPEFPVRWREINSRGLAGEKLAPQEELVERPDGGIEWVRRSVGPWRTADGPIGGLLVSCEIITEQVKAKQALAQGEALFHAGFDNAAVGIAHVAPDGRFLRANDALGRFLGYPVGELLTKSFQDVTYPDDLADEVARHELISQGKSETYDSEARYLRKDGAIIWCRKTVGCVRKDDGSTDYFVSTIEDISARKQAEMELRENMEHFRSSLLHSPLPIFLFDDREKIIAISESWLEQSGYSRAELCRMEDWTIRAHGERSHVALEQIRQVLMGSTELPEVRTAEMMIRTKDGRERLWNFFTSATPIRRFDGRRLFINIAQDVTDQKAHEEQVHLLMREIDHRARNMLSLVQVIARQTAARDPEDFLERFTGRVQALAANQELLRQNEWRGVDVEDLIRAELVGYRITVHGSPVRLNPAAAQAIGLALHELATNAGKYGALSTEAGDIDVGWQSEGDVFTMNWTERNGPPVSPPERHGFGSTVVDSMMKQSVGGEVELNYAPSGLIWRLTCPAANALEHWETSQGGKD